MVLDPMTGEEQEPQDMRIVIAHKVQRRFLTKASVHERCGPNACAAAFPVFIAKHVRQGERQATEGDTGYYIC